MKVSLFADLDNTLIHSHRKQLTEPKTCVELLNGKNQSFSLNKLSAYLSKQNWMDLIPLTMRTTAQYRRLDPFVQMLGLSRALACNGAVLLNGFENDDGWIERSKQLISNNYLSFKSMLDDSVGKSVILEDPFMFYIKTDKPAEVFNHLKELSCSDTVNLYMDSRKVYFLPAPLNKGRAVNRILEESPALCIAMGDSEPDIPMLNESDYALCPETLYDVVDPRRKKYCCNFRSSDSVIRALDSIKDEVFRFD